MSCVLHLIEMIAEHHPDAIRFGSAAECLGGAERVECHSVACLHGKAIIAVERVIYLVGYQAVEQKALIGRALVAY